MSATGIKQYYDLMGLDSGSFVIWYNFTSGQSVANLGNYPTSSGILSSIGNFYQNSGSGYFSGQQITIQNVQNLTGDFWTHLFITEKINTTGGILFDSFSSGNGVFSGYLIGFNDANRLFFEHYDQFGPAQVTSNIVLGNKNALAVSRSNNSISFYCYDYNQEKLLSDFKVINGQYLKNSLKAVIGKTSGTPSYVNYRNYNGYIDDYVYIKDSIIPSHLKKLFSGFVSSYQTVPGTVISSTGIEITGYSYYLTGVTGVLGTTTTIVSSGTDVFGDNYITFGTAQITGYMTSGSGISGLTGAVVTSYTGESSVQLVVNSGFIEEFKLNEISYLRSIDNQDITAFYVFGSNKKGINKRADYDFVKGSFELDQIYQDPQIQLYANGISLINTGYLVTGNIYNSGYVLSGDYYLNDFLVESTGFFDADDDFTYDIISGTKNRIFATGFTSGNVEQLPLSGNVLIFLNGALLISGYQYSNLGGYFKWITNQFSGATGALSSFPINDGTLYTGIFPTGRNFPRESSMVWLNSQRQIKGFDYIENCSLDLIRNSGIFDSSVESVYDNNEDYWE